MDDARKPIIVTIVIAAVVVLLFLLGVGLGGGDAEGAAAWKDRLAGFGGAAALAPEDVTLGPGCGRDGAAIVFTQECAITVAPRGGGLSLSSPVRSAVLTNGDKSIRLRLVLEGQDIAQDVDPDGRQSLTFGPEGGTLTLTCAVALAECAVALA